MRRAWGQAWRDVGVHAPHDLFRALRERYSEAHRAYHDWRHVEACLHVVSEHLPGADRACEVVLALFFHDAVYEPLQRDNEARSAAWAQQEISDAGAPEVAARVASLVLATAHGKALAGAAIGPDADLVLDADLSILGAPPEVYDRFERAIRQEYAAVPADVYRTGRAAVLEGFLAGAPVYRTEAFRARYEDQAQRNLTRALRALEEHPAP